MTLSSKAYILGIGNKKPPEQAGKFHLGGNFLKVIICDDYKSQSAAGADIIEKIVREKPDCCLGLATGSSPVGMYQELARRCREEGLDFSRVSSVK